MAGSKDVGLVGPCGLQTPSNASDPFVLGIKVGAPSVQTVADWGVLKRPYGMARTKPQTRVGYVDCKHPTGCAIVALIPKGIGQVVFHKAGLPEWDCESGPDPSGLSEGPSGSLWKRLRIALHFELNPLGTFYQHFPALSPRVSDIWRKPTDLDTYRYFLHKVKTREHECVNSPPIWRLTFLALKKLRLRAGAIAQW